MRTAKKIVWVALALLPMLSFIWLIAGQIGQQKDNVLGIEGAIFIPLWEDINIQELDDGYYMSNLDSASEGFSLTSASVMIFAGTDPLIQKNTVLGAFCGLYQILMEECEIPCGAPTFFAMLYLFYLAFIEIVSLLIDFIMFIPRKCGEIFH